MFGRRLIYISTDEVVFEGRKMRNRKWTPESEKNVISAMKPKCKDNAWGGMNKDGKINLYFITENIYIVSFASISQKKCSLKWK